MRCDHAVLYASCPASPATRPPPQSGRRGGAIAHGSSE